VEVKGAAGEAARAFLGRFTTLVPDTSLSGYAIVDGADTEKMAAYFDRNRPVVTYEDFVAQSGMGLDTVARRVRLDAALASRNGFGRSEVEMLLATWPDDQDPAAAEAHACAVLETWPRMLLGSTTRTERGVEAGDFTLHRKFVRFQGANGLAEPARRPRFEETTLLSTDNLDELLAQRTSLPRLRGVHLRGVPTVTQWEALAEMPLEDLAVQDFTSRNVIGLDTARWWNAPLGRSLRVLITYGVKLRGIELKPMAKGEGHLEHVRFENARLSGATAGKALSAIGALHPLRSMILRYNELGPAGVAAMFAKGGFPSLRALDLSANEIGDGGIEAIARCPSLGNLRWLSARSNAQKGVITTAGAVALAGAASLSQLHALFLMGQPLKSEGVSALLASSALPRLRTLNASYAGATWAELITRLEGVETVPVTHLDLANTYGGADPQWARAAFLRSVRALRVDGLEGGHLAGLLASGNLDGLETLALGGVYAEHEAAFDALCAAAPLPALKVLSLNGWKLDVAGAQRLCTSPLVRAVDGIELMASRYVSAEAARVFLDAGVRLVMGPEFSEYVANDVRGYDFAYEDVDD